MRTIHSVPALAVALLFGIGIYIGKLDVLPGEYFFAGALTCLLGAVALALFSRNTRSAPFLSLSMVFLIIFAGAAKLHTDSPAHEEDSYKPIRDVELTGRIVDPPVFLGNRTRFALDCESVADSLQTRLRGKILVTVTRRKRDTVDIPFTYGTALRVRGILSRPSPERNPGEFDARAYYAARGIAHFLRVRGYENVEVLNAGPSTNLLEWVMKQAVIPVRHYILDLTDRTIGGEEGELLKGIFIGERSGISIGTRNAFVDSGISHLLAVSGGNVVILWGILTTILLVLRLPRTVRAFTILLCILFYMLLTGSEPPIVRATIMGGVFLVGKLLGIKSNGLNSLGVAALIILGWDARQLFDVSFQLSFVAVFSLVYVYPLVRGWFPPLVQSSWWRLLLARSFNLAVLTLVATVGTLPFIAVYFGKVSVVGIFTNILIVPTVAVSIFLGLMSSLFGWLSVPVAELFAALNLLLLKFTIATASFSGGLSWATVDTLQFKPLYALPFYAALGFLLHVRNPVVSRKFLIAFCVLVVLNGFAPVAPMDQPVENRLRVSFIDVGQGDAALVEFPGGATMLVDAGPKSAEYDAGERVVVPFLKRRGIAKIDYLVASHPHADHIGGFARVLSTFEVKQVIESGQPARDPVFLEYADAVRREQSPVAHARAMDSSFSIGSARVYTLYPTATFIDTDTSRPHANLNNTSVVLKVCFGETSILFTGDAEREAEQEMLQLYGNFLRATVLKAGHHGSATSNSQEFLDAVRPHYAIISSGVHNSFGHPSDVVLQRLQEMNVEILRTDDEGAIILESDGEQFYRIEWR